MSQMMRPATIELVGEMIASLQYFTGFDVLYNFKRLADGDEVYLVIGAGPDGIEHLKHFFHYRRMGVETAVPIHAVSNTLFFPAACPQAMVKTLYGNFGYDLMPDPVVLKMLTQFATLNVIYMRYHYLRLHKAQ